MTPVEVLEVKLHEPRSERLCGCHIDLPRKGEIFPAPMVDLIGWALAPDGPVTAIELAQAGKAFRRLPLNHHRPDLAAAFPDVPAAEKGGFRVTGLPVLGDCDIELRAILHDQARVPLGQVRLCRTETAGPLVSVVIPCFRQARFLGEAIESALRQTYACVEIVVVDDGSPDNTASVAARYPGVRYLRQANAGLSAARNAGLAASRGEFVLFLDADDRLRPEAVRAGLDALLDQPECGLAVGAHQVVAFDGTPLATDAPRYVEKEHYRELLRLRVDCIPSSVLFRREALDRVGGFDLNESAAADLDICLRVARERPIRCHHEVVVDYRRHGGNMTHDFELMLSSALRVLHKQWPHAKECPRLHEAYREGVCWIKEYYDRPLSDQFWQRLQDRDWGGAGKSGLTILRRYRRGPRRDDAQGVPASSPPIGRVDFRMLRSVEPISREFGFDRGQPIDRYFIETFLARHAADVCGRVLEVGDDTYTRRFGGARVTHADVLDVRADNPQATLVADLSEADWVPAESFDCIILTQTLQLVYDVRTAVRHVCRLLKPGGVLLATLPGITPLGDTHWRDSWCWSFTRVSARRLLEEAFPPENVQVEAHGNVLAAVSFLHGLAARDLRRDELEHRDKDYPVAITVRAVKPGEPLGRSRPLARGEANGHERPGRAVVLLYHRVAELESDPWLLGVTPSHFAEQLDVLRRQARPMLLPALLQALDEDRVPDRAVPVTFDDGYADLLGTARPLLETFDVPATAFLVAGCFERRREFTWDELERLLLLPGELPPSLQLSIRGRLLSWELGESARCDEAEFRKHRRWLAWEPPPTERHGIYHALWKLLLTLSPSEQDRVLEELTEWAGSSPEVRPTHRALSVDEGHALTAGGLVELGAHTVNHPWLSALSCAEQREEVAGSRARLEERFGRPVTAFSYPFGRLNAYDSETVALAREAGYRHACSNFNGLVRRSSDRLQLPRRVVLDWDGEEFGRQLAQWFEEDK
jgi:glycosyltransferase involved in cell wall biosynthesis/peptidoglycan/xylan/chitin deacetylase (PgdA/CDA1 family)